VLRAFQQNYLEVSHCNSIEVGRSSCHL